MTSILRCLPFGVLLLASLPGLANAQIYQWRDANGNISLSDHLPDKRPQTYRVIGTTFRTTRPAQRAYVNSYDALIERHATNYGVRPDLVRAVIQVESGFNPLAISPKGAKGLMQLMPGTAVEMGVRNAFDPDENIRGGVAYLRQLLNRYQDETLALAAYNAGPDAVDRHDLSVPPYPETQKYVSAVSSRSGSGPISFPRITGKRASAPPAPRARSAATAPAARAEDPPHRIYKWFEKTPDGRLIPKFSDTRPAAGQYEIVR